MRFGLIDSRLDVLSQGEQNLSDLIFRKFTQTGEQRTAFNEFGRDIDRIVSPQAYQEALAWVSVGVNPPGAKQPGFGSWARPPR